MDEKELQFKKSCILSAIHYNYAREARKHKHQIKIYPDRGELGVMFVTCRAPGHVGAVINKYFGTNHRLNFE